MRCVFIGHHDSPDYLKPLLRERIINLVLYKRVSEFYVGNNGYFDFMVQTVMHELKQDGFSVPYKIVLSRIDEIAIGGQQEATFFPEELAVALPRFAICKRNEWLLARADIAIVYVKYSFSNAGKWLLKAQKREIKIVNLASPPNVS